MILEVMLIKIAQAGSLGISYLLFWWAQITDTYSDPFSEAAKYGFAVLFMLIALYLLYKDYRRERDYSNQLNEAIQKMVDENRKALQKSSEALEKSSEALNRQAQSNERLVIAIETSRK